MPIIPIVFGIIFTIAFIYYLFALIAEKKEEEVARIEARKEANFIKRIERGRKRLQKGEFLYKAESKEGAYDEDEDD